MTAPQKLVLYIDVVSPWTYVAFTVLQRYKKPWNLDLKIVPINLGYVMKVRQGLKESEEIFGIIVKYSYSSLPL